jgi:hypothetical protein
MWVSEKVQKRVDDLYEQIRALGHHNGELRGQLAASLQENVRLAANIEWFKLRLNMVEKERAQLIFAATGQKISVPEFVPTYDAPETALGEQPDFAAVGEDARSDADYSLMPERKNN